MIIKPISMTIKLAGLNLLHRQAYTEINRVSTEF